MSEEPRADVGKGEADFRRAVNAAAHKAPMTD
jgi:hypothetical protein